MQGRSESHPPGTVTATGTSGCHVVVNAATSVELSPLSCVEFRLPITVVVSTLNSVALRPDS